MRRVVKKIAVNGTVAAVILLGFGFLLAEAAGFLLAQPATRDGPAAADTAAATRRALRTRVPVTMALWGVGLVAVWEITAFLLRGEPKPAAPRKLPAPTDAAANQLEDLVRQSDAAKGDSAGTPRPQTPGAVS
jgi:hypothetical protein